VRSTRAGLASDVWSFGCLAFEVGGWGRELSRLVAFPVWALAGVWGRCVMPGAFQSKVKHKFLLRLIQALLTENAVCLALWIGKRMLPCQCNSKHTHTHIHIHTNTNTHITP